MDSLIKIVVISLLVIGQTPNLKSASKPTYTTRKMQGWTIRVNDRLLKTEKALGDEALELLNVKLIDIKRAVPPDALKALRKVTIWLGAGEGHAPCAEYHPNRDWLIENGYDPAKAKCVEIGNARNFIDWSRDQPSMVLHELAHAYHDQVLGFDNPEIQAAYENAVKEGRYNSVLHISGRMEKHYALTNAREYFAECTEAFFGTNDFYPFVRAELAQQDPTVYKLLERLWNQSASAPHKED